eukprot:1954559-Lingulodinium_polyedra.AAC.1
MVLAVEMALRQHQLGGRFWLEVSPFSLPSIHAEVASLKSQPGICHGTLDLAAFPAEGELPTSR